MTDKERYQLAVGDEQYTVERWPAENFRGWHVQISGGGLALPIESLVDNPSLVEDYGFQMVSTVAVGDSGLWSEVVADLLHDRSLGLK